VLSAASDDWSAQPRSKSCLQRSFHAFTVTYRALPRNVSYGRSFKLQASSFHSHIICQQGSSSWQYEARGLEGSDPRRHYGVGYLRIEQSMRGEVKGSPATSATCCIASRFRPHFWVLGCSTAASYDREMYYRERSNSHPSPRLAMLLTSPWDRAHTKLCAQRSIISEGYHTPICTSRRHDIRIAHRLRQSNILANTEHLYTPFSSSLVSSSMTVQSEQVLTVLHRIQNSVEVVSLNSGWRNAINPFCRFRLARSSLKKIGKIPSMS
jgi:hypothetical protein